MPYLKGHLTQTILRAAATFPAEAAPPAILDEIQYALSRRRAA